MLEAVEVIVAVETQGLMVNPGSLSSGGYQPLRRLCDPGWGSGLLGHKVHSFILLRWEKVQRSPGAEMGTIQPWGHFWGCVYAAVINSALAGWWRARVGKECEWPVDH